MSLYSQTFCFQTEFTRGLLHTVAAKLKHDIPELLFDDQLLCHTIDELLLFDKELRNSYYYPNSQPGCLHILTEQACFDKWIAIERQCKLQSRDGFNLIFCDLHYVDL